MKIKKILIISHHFWPENFLINEIALKLKKKFKVSVITGLPNYPKGEILRKYQKIISIKKENFNGVNIIRIPIIPRKQGKFYQLIFNYLSYLISGFYFLRKINFNKLVDHIFVYSTSPITTALLGIYLKKKLNKKMTIWIQDLWPDSVKNTGYIKNNFLIYLISIIVKYIYKNSNNIIAQSKAFKKNISKYTNKKIKIVENSHFNIQKKKINIPNKMIIEFTIIDNGTKKWTDKEIISKEKKPTNPVSAIFKLYCLKINFPTKLPYDWVTINTINKNITFRK